MKYSKRPRHPVSSNRTPENRGTVRLNYSISHPPHPRHGSPGGGTAPCQRFSKPLASTRTRTRTRTLVTFEPDRSRHVPCGLIVLRAIIPPKKTIVITQRSSGSGFFYLYSSAAVRFVSPAAPAMTRDLILLYNS